MNSSRLRGLVACQLLLVFGWLSQPTSVLSEEAGQPETHETWRSVLYPVDWSPTDEDDHGRFLHDFSFAGYAMGSRPIPDLSSAPVIIVEGADPTGESDSTQAIQQAIDDAGEIVASGASTHAIVQLPAGTLRVSLPEGARACLSIRRSGVVLRGSVEGETRLFGSDRVMRGKQVVAVGSGDWSSTAGAPIELARDVPNRATEIPLESIEGVEVGEWVVLRADVTDAFIEDNGMQDWWTTRLAGPMFYRQIQSIDASASTVTIDIPTRHPLLRRDRARLIRARPHISEVGIENLKIGSLCFLGQGFGSNDYNQEGTAAYNIHGAHVITVRHVVDGWIRDVHSFAPPGSHQNRHMPSNGLLLIQCRNVTVERCEMSHPQYEGAGGNGYGFTLRGNDCLVTNCEVVSSRHAYDFKSMYSSGNVVHRSTSRDAFLPSDFHMHLSMSNLFDCMTMDGDFLEARVRPWGSTNKHGHATTQSVFWNTTGLRPHRGKTYVVLSRQFGHGYVIGTQGDTTDVVTRPTEDHGRETAPEDFVEGEGRGATLVPQSLYEDQRRRRWNR